MGKFLDQDPTSRVILARIASGKGLDRTNALKDLKHMLEQNRNSSRVEPAKDGDWHDIYEALFKYVSVEKSAFIKTSSSRDKSRYASHLEFSASVLRIAAELGVQKIRSRTMKALVEHVVQILPTPIDGFCEPLSSDYVKSLRTVLEHQPHVEHLSKNEWKPAVELCIVGIRRIDQSSSNGTEIGANASNAHGIQAFPASQSTISNFRSASREGYSIAMVSDLLSCLHQLTLAPNAPIIDHAEPILSCLVDHLKGNPEVTGSRLAVFRIISSVLVRTRSDASSLTIQCMKQILPLVKSLWLAKDVALKDEMLIVLVLGRDHLTNLIGKSGNEVIIEEIQSLVDVMFAEYCRRSERIQSQPEKNQLNLEDLRLCCRDNFDSDGLNLRHSAFQLSSVNTKTENQWTILDLIACFSSQLDVNRQSANAQEALDVPRKKRRTLQNMHELLRQSLTASVSTKTTALQVIAFAFSHRAFDKEELTVIIEHLTSFISSKDNLVSSWAMVALSSAAIQVTSSVSELGPHWIKIWQLAFRGISSRYTCRSACHLMDVILTCGLAELKEVVQSVQAMLSTIDLTGPFLLADSSLSFLDVVLGLTAATSPKNFDMARSRVIHWIFKKWTPSSFGDRLHLSSTRSNLEPWDIMRLICTCIGRAWPLIRMFPSQPLGLIAHAWIHCRRHQGLTDYLLLQNHSPESLRVKDDNSVNPKFLTGLSDIALESLLLDCVLAEMRDAQQALSDLVDEHSQSLNMDTVRTFASLFFVCAAILDLTELRDARRLNLCLSNLNTLLRSFTSFLSRQNCEQSLVDAVLGIIRICLPDVLKSAQSAKEELNTSCLARLCLSVSSALDSRQNHIASMAQGLDDFMDVDSEFDSQASNLRNVGREIIFPRRFIYAQADPITLNVRVIMYVHFLASFSDATASDQPLVTAEFVERLLALPTPEFLACGQLIAKMLRSQYQLHTSSAERITEHLARNCLGAYRYERSEISIGMCIDVVDALAPLWADQERSQLREICWEMYEWFISVALAKGISSPNTQIDIARLLRNLLKMEPRFAGQTSIPSVRTSLLRILQDGEIPVKYFVGSFIQEIFGLFVLSKHDAIFDDIHTSLPMEVDSIEGMAIRVMILSKLAGAWYTLLRRGVYHIFEAAGVARDAVPYAKFCIAQLASKLKLRHPGDLFRLFSSQLLYSWLESQPLNSVPFEIFGFDRLDLMLQGVQDEAFGQLIMRQNVEGLASLGDCLGLTLERMWRNFFAKAAAYCICNDVCFPASQASVSSPSQSEVYLRGHIGDEHYFALIEQNLPRIMGVMFLKIEQDDQIDRALSKRPSLQRAAAALTWIKKVSASDYHLPLNQQPSFRARYLVDELDRLCNRTSLELLTVWNPTLLVYVARMLIDAIHPALGPLHSCAIIRKLRIVICLAGPVALDGYPLEMLLHALRPFLTDSHCASDTIGLVQYLLNYGKLHLCSVPTFMADWTLLTFLSLRTFLEAPQDSTTQESQHRATISRARAFHTWYGNFLGSYEPTSEKEIPGKSFTAFFQVARMVRNEGNSIMQTPESNLLLELLDELRRDKCLLSEVSLKLGFRFLSQGFQYPLSPREDVFGSDEQAASYASAVLGSVQCGLTSDPYSVWAGKVIGRGYACRGEVRGQIWRETSLQDLLRPVPEMNSNLQSKSAIMRTICQLLLDEDHTRVAIAEDTLRFISTRLTDANEESAIEQVLPLGLFSALSWSSYRSDADAYGSHVCSYSAKASSPPAKDNSVTSWIHNFVLSLCKAGESDAVVGALLGLVASVEGIAERLFPYVLHLVLALEFDAQQATRKIVSQALDYWFRRNDPAAIPCIRALVNAILYLRTQPMPRETTMVERDLWLDIDYALAAEATVRCGMFKTGLLFLELHEPCSALTLRRSSVARPLVSQLPNQLLLEIFKNVDDPDSFYGVQESASLATVMRRVDYEGDGLKSLLMHSASLDSALRRQGHSKEVDIGDLVPSLMMLNLNGLTHTLLTSQNTVAANGDPTSSLLRTAQRLDQWDIATPAASSSEVAITFQAFRSLNYCTSVGSIRDELDRKVLEVVRQLAKKRIGGVALRPLFRTLSILSEIDDVVSLHSPQELEDVWKNMRTRELWMVAGRLDDIAPILAARETLFSALNRSSCLRDTLHISPAQTRSFQVKALLCSSALYRMHDAPEKSLAIVTHLSNMVESIADLGLHIDALVKNEVANVLWDQGELTASIRLLQELAQKPSLEELILPLGRAGLLARLANHLAASRLEKPEEIISNYLSPAVEALNGGTQGTEAGQVYHEFAAFCDKQLSDPDGLEDFARVAKMREHKKQEVRALEILAKTTKSGHEKDNTAKDLSKAKRWYNIDDLEYQRLRITRDAFLKQSFHNYLLSLNASEEYNNDVLRFFTLWLDNADTPIADDAVTQRLDQVPSRKFAPLMNQLTSKLQNLQTNFHKSLRALVLRICAQHPYHGMYHVFAGRMTKPGNDALSQSRQVAADLLSQHLLKHAKVGGLYKKICDANVEYMNLAKAARNQYKQFAKVQLRKLPEGVAVEQGLLKRRLPPPTMPIQIRENMNYDEIPTINSYGSEITIMPGNSAPKVLTARMSDGASLQFLLKWSADDLRQDAIMEQVFEQVSQLLNKDKATRQRDLHIRTYKVVPFSQVCGAIEFVPNTEPLSNFLMKGHPIYYLKDMKPDIARSRIHEYQQRAKERRVQVFRSVCEKFNPVFRFFFLERFKDPDEWFEKRLAYTRSTAAISMLGHVLGLGDRHLHNLLIDVKTGEIVHIDLGVAFEAGRVLPVPEVIPFRLTRDIVDGMGTTKTEGVFRRCCEFTLDALRNEKDGIMTLLNVLRYDPLYSWSISPLKAKKMQEEADNDEASAQAPSINETGREPSRKQNDEVGEAQRALSVVEKKLSRTLSTAATVNELIREATDERNLAVLFSGWQAYC